MKLILKNTLLIGTLFVSMTISSKGQSLTNTAGSFVDIGFGNRASGMGFAYTGLAEGADAIMWNPAGLAQNNDIQVSMMYAKQYNLINYNYASGVIPFNDGQHIVGFAVVSSGDEVLRENTAYASYSKKLIERLYVGATAKLRLNSFGNNNLNAEDYVVFTPNEIEEGFGRQIYGKGNGFGFDLGILFKASTKLQVGVMARDIYSSFKWDTKIRDESESKPNNVYNENLPIEIVFGVSYNVLKDLYINTDLLPSFTELGEDIVRAGIEKKFLDVLYLRGGTEQKLQSNEIDHYMAGFGIETPQISGARFSAHYTYVMNELANTHRLGLQIKL